MGERAVSEFGAANHAPDLLHSVIIVDIRQGRPDFVLSVLGDQQMLFAFGCDLGLVCDD